MYSMYIIPMERRIAETVNNDRLDTMAIRRHITMMLEDHILETEHPGDSRAYRIKGTKIVMVKEKKDKWK